MKQETIEELRIEREKLMAKVNAIDMLLGPTDDTQDLSSHSSNGNARKTKQIVNAYGIPKGKTVWDDYAKLVLKEIGGTGKSQDAIVYAKNANPRIPESTIVYSMRGTLSRLAKNDAINVEKAAIKSEGNTYSLKQ